MSSNCLQSGRIENKIYTNPSLPYRQWNNICNPKRICNLLPILTASTRSHCYLSRFFISFAERQQQQHSQIPEQGQGHQQQSQQSPAPSSTAPSSCEAVTLRVANPLDNLTTPQRRARDDNVSGRNQFANRVLCRTPPPVYDLLPATPPPSYTPHGAVVADVLAADGGAIDSADVACSAEVWRQYNAAVPAQRQAFSAPQCGSNVADYVEVLLPVCSVGYQQRPGQQRTQQQLVELGENVAPTVGQQQEQQPEQAYEADVQVGEQQQHQQLQQQQQQHLRRRRRLHLLQQQRLSNINATSTESTNSSNCSISNRNNNNNNSNNNNCHFNNHNHFVGISGGGGDSSSDSEAYARLPIGSERRRQRRQQRIGRGLRGMYTNKFNCNNNLANIFLFIIS